MAPPITRLEYALLAAVVLWATVLRTWALDRPLFWVDEAESTVNALTILQHGYPADHYLGLPIYENTLTRPWPDSPEYEFKDSSYSDRGVAIYHGWLPLYAIAASLKASGIAPDPAPADPREHTPAVRHDERHVRRVTAAARAPAAAFGVAFLALLFVAGRELGGRDVGWAAAVVGALAERTVEISREARYYSATAFFGLACCLMVFRMARSTRWRDFLAGGVAFGLLFHTHVVTFLVASAAMALAAVVTVRDRQRLRKLCGFAAVVAAATVPWAVLTGFLTQASAIPKAWPNLKFPADYLLFPMDRLPTVAVLGAGVLALLAADLFRRRLPARFVEAFVARRAAFYLLAAWVGLAYLAFVFLMPAVSFVAGRMTLPMLGPGILMAAMIFAAAARCLLARPTPVLATALFLGFMVCVNGLHPLPAATPGSRSLSGQVEYTLDWLRRCEFRPGTRLYATPNKHLVLSVYTGMPVQNVAPVRKTFLDAYDRDVFVIECVVPFQPPPIHAVLAAAEAAGWSLSAGEAKELSWLVTQRAIAEATVGTVREVEPPLRLLAVPEYLLPLVDAQPAHTAEHLRFKADPVRECPAVFRGHALQDWADWWPVYFYRFVSPASRSGTNLNYAARARSGRVTILPVGWRVYEMPARAAPAGGDAADAADGER